MGTSIVFEEEGLQASVLLSGPSISAKGLHCDCDILDTAEQEKERERERYMSGHVLAYVQKQPYIQRPRPITQFYLVSREELRVEGVRFVIQDEKDSSYSVCPTLFLYDTQRFNPAP